MRDYMSSCGLRGRIIAWIIFGENEERWITFCGKFVLCLTTNKFIDSSQKWFMTSNCFYNYLG